MSNNSNSPTIGAVVIGRNEGQRLIRCLEPLNHQVHVVYVDSGSTDGSVVAAKALGATVVELDMQQPFTAARARNAGVQRLLELHPQTQLIQFVDGDCEIVDGWLHRASEFLTEHPEYAIVCGRRRERYPSDSLYNQLCDIEWDTPVGDALACGGDALIRVSALKQVAGYRDSMIAGEEPEMCYRLRHAGWKIFRLDAEMTLHDAAMTRFDQWWKRNKRAGHAYAESLQLHHLGKEKFRLREVASIILWAMILPLFIVLMVLMFSAYALLLLVIYPLQVIRLSMSYRVKLTGKNAFIYASSNVIGKFAQLSGVMSFYYRRIFNKSKKIIEYK
ncbi:glycosyl transferase [Methylophaga lonarensis MPL]|uniref:Glycosyl transferase n=1 Tax=Methylophaga lonarensis MPL TaxID=1286106 RepID=M7PKG6_9GAMM|nr:glycosyltransferase family A protein [Methylophaga lonarensis]EMR14360.1 glycosyl transferase [Methylophaga lonarensis MPL]